MATRSRSSKKKYDEIEFPIRVRYVVPEEGLGRRSEQIYEWLDQYVGRGHYATNADSLPGARDASSYYFKHMTDAMQHHSFMNGLGITLAEPEAGGWRRG